MGSQVGGSTHSSVSDWAAVLIMIVGLAAMGGGIIAAAPWLGVVGGVLLVSGAVYALVIGIMNHTEDYPAQHRDSTT